MLCVSSFRIVNGRLTAPQTTKQRSEGAAFGHSSAEPATSHESPGKRCHNFAFADPSLSPLSMPYTPLSPLSRPYTTVAPTGRDEDLRTDSVLSAWGCDSPPSPKTRRGNCGVEARCFAFCQFRCRIARQR